MRSSDLQAVREELDTQLVAGPLDPSLLVHRVRTVRVAQVKRAPAEALRR